jgi:hypothetical protein
MDLGWRWYNTALGVGCLQPRYPLDLTHRGVELHLDIVETAAQRGIDEGVTEKYGSDAGPKERVLNCLSKDEFAAGPFGPC